MKILMLGWELPPNNSGGLGVACLQLAKALSKSGADIDFILPFSTDEDYEFMNVTSAHPSSVRSISLDSAYDSYKFVYKDGSTKNVGIVEQQHSYELAVGELIKSREFDVIHAHDWLTFRAALRAKFHSGRPLIVHVHSIERDRAGGNPGNPMVREIEATTMLLADRVIAVSGRVKQMISEDYHIPLSKIDVVHNSIDHDYLEPLDDANAYKYLIEMKKNGWKVVANIGRLTIQKGLTHFLRAAALVAKNEPKTFFLIVGSGEQRDELIEIAAELGIADRVLFTGFQRGKRWRDAYSVADLFVMPSVSEPFGLTPLEAVMYGTPALVSKQSGVSEVLINCLKVDFWDEKEIANQITATLKYDVLAKELHSNALKEVEKMSWSESADKLMNIYKSHLQKVAA